ncbi:hypothetical protein Tco_0459811 [Tanacetum coccineum]
MVVRTHMRILSVVRIKSYSHYGYDYLKEITLRRSDHQEYMIAEKDFKNLYPSDFEDLNCAFFNVILNNHPVDIEKVAVRSSLRSLKPKRTIKSRAKRSSINLIRTPFLITCSSLYVKIRVIIRVLRIILVVLPEHSSDTYVFTMKMEILLEPTSNKLMVGKLGDSDVHTLEDPTLILEIMSMRFFLRLNLPNHKSVLTGSGVKMEMEIPRTSGVYFITACSYLTNTSNDIMKVQAYVSKLPQL